MLLLFYSLGLAIPFILAALAIGQLSQAIKFVREHYRVINIICGIFLIVVGVLMILGVSNAWAADKIVTNYSFNDEASPTVTTRPLSICGYCAITHSIPPGSGFNIRPTLSRPATQER